MTSGLAYNLRIVGVVWQRELLRLIRDRSQVFSAVSRTVLWLIVLGFGLGAALREVLVSPAPLLPFTLGKLLGGATIAVLLGSIPLLVAPFVGVEFTVLKLLLTWLLMFALGLTMTGIGVFIATQLRTFESFGSVSNGLIMPLYFLSGSIFPLRGVIGGVGFLDIPSHLRLELSQLGVNTLGGGWVVQLPVWIRWLVYANPVSYYLDMLRRVLLRYGQLNPDIGLLVSCLMPVAAVTVAVWSLGRLRRG